MADLHLQVVPGTGTFAIRGVPASSCRAAGSIARGWPSTDGADVVIAALTDVPVAEFADRSGIPMAQITEAAQRIAGAESVSVLEDLGIEMAPNSTLVSYLQKLMWVLVGSFGRRR